MRLSAGSGRTGPEAAQRWFRNFRLPTRPRLRLVCCPHAGGSAAAFRAWTGLLPDDVELRAVRYPGREDRIAEPFATGVEELAEGLASALAELPAAATVVFGHSLGAIVGYEAARRWTAAGRSALVLLAVSGRPAPQYSRPVTVRIDDDAALWAEVARLGGAAPAVLDQPELRRLALPVLRADYVADATYRHRPGPPLARPILACPVLACLGEDDTEVSAAEAAGWAAVTTGPSAVRTFSGGHFYLDPAQGVLGTLLDELLLSSGARPPVEPNDRKGVLA
jgi:pyochelin biosynthetic protein PchC